MDREKILSMDPYILLSTINMKLRDEFLSLHEFCLEYDMDDTAIIEKLENIGYLYNRSTNQFISEG